MLRHPVKQRIKIREKAVGHKRKGKITGRGTVHAPSPEIQEKYAEAVRLYSTTTMSALRIAKMTGVSRKGFYEYLHRWHMEQGVKLNDELVKIFQDKVVGFPTLMEVIE